MQSTHTIADRIRTIVEEFGSSIGYQQVQQLLRERYGLSNVPMATIFNVRWKMLDQARGTGR